MAKEKSNSKKSIAGALIPAGLLIGLGIGMIYNHVAAGLLIGLGVGFLAFVIIMLRK